MFETSETAWLAGEVESEMRPTQVKGPAGFSDALLKASRGVSVGVVLRRKALYLIQR
jgi:hypothetical protein